MLKRNAEPPRTARGLDDASVLRTSLAFKRLPETPPLSTQQTKLLLVDFRNGESVCQHPELQPHLRAGWQIKSAVPRLVEGEGTRLLVVLTQPTPEIIARTIR